MEPRYLATCDRYGLTEGDLVTLDETIHTGRKSYVPAHYAGRRLGCVLIPLDRLAETVDLVNVRLAKETA